MAWTSTGTSTIITEALSVPQPLASGCLELIMKRTSNKRFVPVTRRPTQYNTIVLLPCKKLEITSQSNS